jgi:hypothetical protein
MNDGRFGNVNDALISSAEDERATLKMGIALCRIVGLDPYHLDAEQLIELAKRAASVIGRYYSGHAYTCTECEKLSPQEVREHLQNGHTCPPCTEYRPRLRSA